MNAFQFTTSFFFVIFGVGLPTYLSNHNPFSREHIFLQVLTSFLLLCIGALSSIIPGHSSLLFEQNNRKSAKVTNFHRVRESAINLFFQQKPHQNGCIRLTGNLFTDRHTDSHTHSQTDKQYKCNPSTTSFRRKITHSLSGMQEVLGSNPLRGNKLCNLSPLNETIN